MHFRSVSIRVRGRVQGVWYRASAKVIAEQLDITGFVSNAPDGSVYIEARGSVAAIEQFIAWCKEGPELARVDHVEISEIECLALATFEVRRS